MLKTAATAPLVAVVGASATQAMAEDPLAVASGISIPRDGDEMPMLRDLMNHGAFVRLEKDGMYLVFVDSNTLDLESLRGCYMPGDIEMSFIGVSVPKGSHLSAHLASATKNVVMSEAIAIKDKILKIVDVHGEKFTEVDGLKIPSYNPYSHLAQEDRRGYEIAMRVVASEILDNFGWMGVGG